MSGITFFFDRKDTYYEPDSIRLLASPPLPANGMAFTVRKFELPLNPSLSLEAPLPFPQTPESYDLGLTTLTNAVSHDLSVDMGIKINGLSIDRSLVSFDFGYGVGKEATGKVVLQANNNVGPASLVLGMDVEIKINGRQQYKGFISSKPVVQSNGGSLTIEFEVGSQAKVRQAQFDKSLYCGLPPKNTRQLAEILSGQFGYQMDATPDGHDFDEVLEDQGFRGIGAIVEAYAVTNHDVFENSNCRVQVTPRGRDNEFYELQQSDIIDIKWQPADNTNTRSAIVSNKYTKDHGYPVEIVKTEKYSDNYNVNNTLPWFKGGWTYTETFTHTKGDTVVKIISNNYGFIPSSWPFVDNNSIDQCVIVSPVPTTYGLINTEEILNYYTPLYMDKQALWKTEKRLSGLSAFRQEVPGPTVTINWQRVYGAIARDITLYKNELIVDPTVLVCPHMQRWYQTLIRRWSFETLGNGGYSLANYEEDHYVYEKSGSAATNFTVGDRGWYHTGSRARINEVNGGWVTVPQERKGIEEAPPSVFMQPLREEVRVEGLYIGEGEQTTGIIEDIRPVCEIFVPGNNSWVVALSSQGETVGSSVSADGGYWGQGASGFLVVPDNKGHILVSSNTATSGVYSLLVRTNNVLKGFRYSSWSQLLTNLSPIVSPGLSNISCVPVLEQNGVYFISPTQGYFLNGAQAISKFSRTADTTVHFHYRFTYSGGSGLLAKLHNYAKLRVTFTGNLVGVDTPVTYPYKAVVERKKIGIASYTIGDGFNLYPQRFINATLGPESYLKIDLDMPTEITFEGGSTFIYPNRYSQVNIATCRVHEYVQNGSLRYYTGSLSTLEGGDPENFTLVQMNTPYPVYSENSGQFIGYQTLPQGVKMRLGATVELFNPTNGTVTVQPFKTNYFGYLVS